ncbi:hypothetical protein [Microbulbifer variabilis]|uniref:hypothetical protein n=1 Tax=Microbulbifer variabilis TaxID=266805 RepID=UPI001CFDBB6D|nr:hypothetical protein [Microbulbifer variabilis]
MSIEDTEDELKKVINEHLSKIVFRGRQKFGGELPPLKGAVLDELRFSVEKKVLEHIEININNSIDNNLSDLSKTIRHDSRWDDRLGTASSIVSKLLIAGCKTIPVIGGFAGLIGKILNNPTQGLWEVFRCQYGDGSTGKGGFNLSSEIFDGKNGVWSPLTYSPDSGDNNHGLKGMNLGNGNSTLFNQDQEMRFQQMEAEMAAAITKDVDDILKNKLGITSGSSTISLDQKKRLVSSCYKAECLIALYCEYKKKPHYYFFRVLSGVTACNLSAKDGVRDIFDGGYINSAGEIYTADELKEKERDIKIYARSGIGGSPLLKLLQDKEISIKNSYKNTPAFNLKCGNNTPLLTKRIFSQAILTKAKYLAYKGVLIPESFKVRKTALSSIVEKNINCIPAEKINLNDNQIGLKVAVCLACCEELIVNYLGTPTISMLPPTRGYFSLVKYVLFDCAVTAATLMEKDDQSAQISWRNWFAHYLFESPEFSVYYNRCKQKLGDNIQWQTPGIMADGLTMFMNETSSNNPILIEGGLFSNMGSGTQNVAEKINQLLNHENIILTFNSKTKGDNALRMSYYISKNFTKPAKIRKIIDSEFGKFKGLSSVLEDEDLKKDSPEFYVKSFHETWTRYKNMYDVIKAPRQGDLRLIDKEVIFMFEAIHEVLKKIAGHTGMRKKFKENFELNE